MKRLILAASLVALGGPAHADPVCDPLADALEIMAETPSYGLTINRGPYRPPIQIRVDGDTVTYLDKDSDPAPRETRASLNEWLWTEARRVRASKDCVLMHQENQGAVLFRIFAPEGTNSDKLIILAEGYGLVKIQTQTHFFSQYLPLPATRRPGRADGPPPDQQG